MAAVTGQPIIVVGMHRSGTSSIMSGLGAIGVYLGTEGQLLGPDKNNEEGYWENAEIVIVNDQLLIQLGMSGNPASIVPDDWQAYQQTPAYLERAKVVVAEVFGGQEVWGWKDPRTSTLIPFWNYVLTEFGVRPHYLVALRHPHNVASSLLKRDELPLSMGYGWWLASTLSSLKHSEGYSRSVMDYEDYLDDPVAAIDLATKGLIGPWQEDKAKVEKLRSIPQRRLNHGAAKPVELPPFVDRVWQYAKGLTSRGVIAPDVKDAELDELWEEFRRWWSLMPMGHGTLARLQLVSSKPGSEPVDVMYRTSYKPHEVKSVIDTSAKTTVTGTFLSGVATLWLNSATITGTDGKEHPLSLQPEADIATKGVGWVLVPPGPHFRFTTPDTAGPYTIKFNLAVDDSAAEQIRLSTHLGETRRMVLHRLMDAERGIRR